MMGLNDTENPALMSWSESAPTSPSSVRMRESTALPSDTWSISMDWMLQPTELAMVVTSATTPARLTMGTRTSSRLSVEGTQAAGSARRASAAWASRSVKAARSPASSALTNEPMMPCISTSPSRRAAALSKAMPHQSLGEPAATRVVSLKPPAARRMSDWVSSAWRLASSTSDEATICGTWLTMATARSCSSRRSDTTRASMPVMSSWRRWKCSGTVSASGQRIQFVPLNRSARAPSMPFCSDPVMGWPGT